MEWYSSIKLIHVFTIHISITLFALRFLMDSQGFDVWRHSFWRILPHINDSLLLVSALALLSLSGWQIFTHFWITAKVFLVVVYIMFGWLALRARIKIGLRWLAFCSAVAVFILIYTLAFRKPVLFF